MAVKAIVYDRTGRCLALRRDPRSNLYPGQWDLPGGKVDDGESFDAALQREVFEETGLRLELMGVIGAWHRVLPKVTSVLLVLEARRRPGRVRLSPEHSEFRWVSPTELARVDWSDEIRLVAQAVVARASFRKRGSSRQRPAQLH